MHSTLEQMCNGNFAFSTAADKTMKPLVVVHMSASRQLYVGCVKSWHVGRLQGLQILSLDRKKIRSSVGHLNAHFSISAVCYCCVATSLHPVCLHHAFETCQNGVCSVHTQEQNSIACLMWVSTHMWWKPHTACSQMGSVWKSRCMSCTWLHCTGLMQYVCNL